MSEASNVPAPPVAGGCPSESQLRELHATIDRECAYAHQPDPAGAEGRKRAVSKLFAAELRRRGWLAPENEGYAPNSWAAKP